MHGALPIELSLLDLTTNRPQPLLCFSLLLSLLARVHLLNQSPAPGGGGAFTFKSDNGFSPSLANSFLYSVLELDSNMLQPRLETSRHGD